MGTHHTIIWSSLISIQTIIKHKYHLFKLYVSYRNIFKLFIGLSKYESASMLAIHYYLLFNIQCCQTVIRNLCFVRSIKRIYNSIVNVNLATAVKYLFRIRIYWMKILYINFTIQKQCYFVSNQIFIQMWTTVTYKNDYV